MKIEMVAALIWRFIGIAVIVSALPGALIMFASSLYAVFASDAGRPLSATLGNFASITVTFMVLAGILLLWISRP